MRKAEIIDSIADKTKLAKIDVMVMVQAFMDVVSDNLKKREDVTLRGFGTFALKRMKQKPARNPKTGEPVIVPARDKIVFVPAKELKEEIHKLSAE